MNRNSLSSLPALLVLAACSGAGSLEPLSASASVPQSLSTPSVEATELDVASKGKLVRMTWEEGDTWQSALLVVYAESVGPEVGNWDGTRHPARDLFVTRSVDGGATWSTPINISRTAERSSRDVDHDGLPETEPIACPGDSGKPNVFAQGATAVVTWCDSFAPGDVQGSTVHPEAGDIETAFRCVYAIRTLDAGASWGAPQQLTDGSRDALQDTVKGNGNGYVIAWQEDPRGLQPGEGDGPGDGGSGARTSRGTDIWATTLATASLLAGEPFPPPVRMTNNFVEYDDDGVEWGTTAASRPQVALVGKTLLLAYEEQKGTDLEGYGKVVRYHALPAYSGGDPTAGAGWILSDLAENARRVRIVVQSQPGKQSGLRLLFLWRQGELAKGAPADVVGRVGRVRAGDAASTGWRTQDLTPAVHAGADREEYAAQNAPPFNLSSRFGIGAPTGLDESENARAHRALLRGDRIMVGYVYTPEGLTESVPYDFYLRRSLDGGRSWELPRNVSRIVDDTLTIFEPRLVGTPGSSNPDEPRDPSVCCVCWSNGNHEQARLQLIWSADFGASWSAVQDVAPAEATQYEAQLRLTPSGDRVAALWMQRDADGRVEAMYHSIPLREETP